MFGSQAYSERSFGYAVLQYDAVGDHTVRTTVHSSVPDSDSDDLETELTTARAMIDEGKRLRTFTTWPPSFHQLPESLAEAGFFYTGRLDRVKCAFCLGVLKTWQPEDIPFVEHQKHFPYCRFIQGEDVGNIPLTRTGIEQVLELSGQTRMRGEEDKREVEVSTAKSNFRKSRQLLKLDIAKAMGQSDPPQHKYDQYRVPPSNYGCQSVSNRGLLQHSSQSTLSAPPITSTSASTSVATALSSSVHHHHHGHHQGTQNSYTAIAGNSKSTISTTDYTSEASRLTTFLQWPAGSKIQPEDLARAGFYFVPTDTKPDRVKCGYCGGKLYGWTEGDDPMVEHSRCFPECPYIKLCQQGRGIESSSKQETVSTRWPGSTSAAMFKSASTHVQPPLVPSNPGSRETAAAHASTGLLVEQQNSASQDVVMRSDSVLQVLAMGFPREKLERIVREKRRVDGREISVQELVEAVLQCQSD